MHYCLSLTTQKKVHIVKNWGKDYDILRSTPILACGFLGYIEVVSSPLSKILFVKTFYILIYNFYMIQVPLYKFLKKIWGSKFFNRQLSCNFLSNRYNISNLKVPPQYFLRLKTYFFHEIITAHTYFNIWKSMRRLWSLLSELLPLLYY